MIFSGLLSLLLEPKQVSEEEEPRPEENPLDSVNRVRSGVDSAFTCSCWNPLVFSTDALGDSWCCCTERVVSFCGTAGDVDPKISFCDGIGEFEFGEITFLSAVGLAPIIFLLWSLGDKRSCGMFPEDADASTPLCSCKGESDLGETAFSVLLDSWLNLLVKSLGEFAEVDILKGLLLSWPYILL